MSAILNREPGTSAQSEENQVSTSTTTQQNVFTVQQIQPQAIFAGAHIDKFEGYTFNINVFCGDKSKTARLNENWSLSDRGTNRHYLHCSCTFVVSTTSFFIEPVWKILSLFIDEVCTKLHELWTVIFVPFGLETSDRRKPGNYINAWARAGRQIKLFMFLFICFLVWPYNKHLINLLTELGRRYRPHCIRSVLATSVKILPYRPSARLIRAKEKGPIEKIHTQFDKHFIGLN